MRSIGVDSLRVNSLQFTVCYVSYMHMHMPLLKLWCNDIKTDPINRCAYLKKNRPKFHPNPIWNDRGFGLLNSLRVVPRRRRRRKERVAAIRVFSSWSKYSARRQSSFTLYIQRRNNGHYRKYNDFKLEARPRHLANLRMLNILYATYVIPR